MARLIVNADDFGYTDGVSRAIAELAGAGAVSSATAMAGPGEPLPNGPAMGCHVVLVDGIPLTQAPSLGNGRFRANLSRFAWDLARGKIADREIEAEALAQIHWLQKRGLRLTHVDTHKHTHIFPRVLRPLLRAALQSGIRAVRNPFEPPWARAATPGASPLRRAQVRLLSGYRRGFLSEVGRAEMRTTDGALGVLATGSLDLQTLDALLAALARNAPGEACYELVCHPGYRDAALDAARTRLKREREVERAALLAAVPRWCGPGKPHRLVSFADL